MLCERCHQREAKVHVTDCNGNTGAMTMHDYCEACAADPQGGIVGVRGFDGASEIA
jgi:protein-arginine kinase activator protein McsA